MREGLSVLNATTAPFTEDQLALIQGDSERGVCSQIHVSKEGDRPNNRLVCYALEELEAAYYGQRMAKADYTLARKIVLENARAEVKRYRETYGQGVTA